jgi:hypothetical protein
LDSENKQTQTLLTIVIEIPAGASAGDYTVEVKDVILTQLTEGGETEFGMQTLTNKTTTASATVKVKEHEYTAGDYVWNVDGANTTCEVVGACACGAKQTAKASVASKETKPATCQANGETTYTATFAETWAQKQTKTVDDIAQLKHDYTGAVRNDGDKHSFMCVNGCQQYGGAVEHTYIGKVTTPNGCTTLGEKTFTCETEGCGATYTEKIAAHGHFFGEVTGATPATCLTPGNDAYKQCTKCEKFFAGDAGTDSIDAKDSADAFTTTKDHSYTGEIKSNGNGEHDTHSFQCVNGCNQYGGAVEHTWHGVETTAPGCTTPGLKTYTCTVDGCGATYTEDISAHGHTFGEVIAAKPATCTSTGNEAYKQCETCGKFFAADAANDSAAGEDSADAFTIAIDENAHAYSTEISGYTDNEDGTHTAYYTCAHNAEHKKVDDPKEHDFSEGDCDCGAKKPAPAGLKGDMNSDGVVDMDDVIALLSHVMKVDGEIISDQNILARGEVTGDTTLDMDDVIKVLQYVMKAGVDTLD